MYKRLDLVVALLNPNGTIYVSRRPANDLERLPILNFLTGEKLFDILLNETGSVRFEDNKFALNVILELNRYPVAMKMLGKVAEAVIVRRCREDEDINKVWIRCAMRKKIKSDTSDRFIAVGTGLLSTKTEFHFRYNPADTQRDIVWVDKETRKCALMAGSNGTAGLEAGLQIKVSKNGAAYFLNDLIGIKYEVPVVYFDICGDFHSIAQKLYEKVPFGSIDIGKDYIQAKAIDIDAYNEVVEYVELIEALLDGRLTPEQMINHQDVNNNAVLKSAITSAALSEINLQNLILP